LPASCGRTARRVRNRAQLDASRWMLRAASAGAPDRGDITYKSMKNAMVRIIAAKMASGWIQSIQPRSTGFGQ
jgi:hypothetical protein